MAQAARGGWLVGMLSVTLSFTAIYAADDGDDGLAKKMFPVYVKEMEGYSLALASAPDKALELKKEPVLEWSNRHRGAGTTQGTLFLWLRDSRPAAVACMFSYPHARLPGRVVAHELHALDTEKLVVTREGPNKWKPEGGLERHELPDAPAPAETPGARFLQIKKLAAEFTGHEIDRNMRRLELRLLPTPLYRYPTAKSGVIDGAFYALVADASTDPEILLVIEARQIEGKVRWEYACGRLSDLELHAHRKDKEVFSFVPGMPSSGPAQLYLCFSEKVVTLEGKLLARMRNWQAIPVEEK